MDLKVISGLKWQMSRLLRHLSRNGSTEDVAEALEHANQAYCTGSSVISDVVYDSLRDILVAKDPGHPLLHNVGAKPSHNKVKLPYYMGSLDKIKLESSVDIFAAKQKGPYTLSDKLDGVSAVYVVSAGVPHLYTRGNGQVGQDLTSTLMPYLRLSSSQDLAIRGELIVTREAFKLLSQKANARNLVSGVVNAKRPDAAIAQYIRFVAYTVFSPSIPDAYQQIKFLESRNFEVVYHRQVTAISARQLLDELIQRKETSVYEIDGVVVTSSASASSAAKQNPTNAFAFKSTAGQATAIVSVKNIVWNLSKDGLFKPTLEFDPVRLSGVHIQRCTGFNAQFVSSNCIGVGSKIKLIRAGEVIPHCEEVLSKSTDGEPLMPCADYVWNATHVDVATSARDSNEDLRLKILQHFTAKMCIEGLGKGITQRLFEGGIDDPKKLIGVTHAQLHLLPGFSDVSVCKMINSILQAKEHAEKDCMMFMIASNAFGQGFGERKLGLIIKKFPFLSDPLNDALPTKTEMTGVNGISDVSATAFFEGLSRWRMYMRVNGFACVRHTCVSATNESLSHFRGKNISFTEVRDKVLEAKLIVAGATIQAQVTKSTDYLITKDCTTATAKVLRAVDNGCVIISIADVLTYTDQ